MCVGGCCVLLSGSGCCAARKRRKSRRKRILGQAAACIPPPAPSCLPPPSFPGTCRDFSVSWQRHLRARGRILRSPFPLSGCQGKVGYPDLWVRPEKSRPCARCPAAHGAAQPSEEPAARAVVRCCRGLRLPLEEGARWPRQGSAAKSVLLSAYPLPEQLLTSAPIVSLAFSKWLFQGEHQLSARADAFGSF